MAVSGRNTCHIPDRFTPERSAHRPRYAYIPFGGGPRLCIGNSLAMMEAQLVLATVAQRYSLRLVPGHPVELQVSVATPFKYRFLGKNVEKEGAGNEQ